MKEVLSLTVAGLIFTTCTASASVTSSGAGGTTTTSITWPSAATFFGLEKADTLTPPVQWQPVTSGIVDSAGVKTLLITNGSSLTNEFFRLEKP